jgi:hypothetical protein
MRHVAALGGDKHGSGRYGGAAGSHVRASGQPQPVGMGGDGLEAACSGNGARLGRDSSRLGRVSRGHGADIGSDWGACVVRPHLGQVALPP